ncbi:hypothetical protein D3C77_460560 [compost metagenome]
MPCQHAVVSVPTGLSDQLVSVFRVFQRQSPFDFGVGNHRRGFFTGFATLEPLNILYSRDHHEAQRSRLSKHHRDTSSEVVRKLITDNHVGVWCVGRFGVEYLRFCTFQPITQVLSHHQADRGDVKLAQRRGFGS